MKISALSTSFVVLALVLATLPMSAYAGLEKLQGTYTGNYTASAVSALQTVNSGGPTTANFKSKTRGTTGKMVLNGSNPSIPGSAYTTQFVFKKGGKATTTAIVPGVVNESATGTWKANKTGKKITFAFTTASIFGIYKSKGKITGNGKSLKINITFTAEVPSPTLPRQGFYNFVGNR